MSPKPARNSKASEIAVGWLALVGGQDPVGSLYEYSPAERIALVKEGVPSAFLVVMSGSIGVTRDRPYQTVSIPRATADRKIRVGRPLSTDEGERVLGVARLIGQVEAIVRASGDGTDFDAAHWLARFIEEPNAALNGRPPRELLDTAEGRDLVSGLIAQMQTGAYA